MKVLILFTLATLAYANVVPTLNGNTAYGYIQNYAIPRAEEIRVAEEQMKQERIVGGSQAKLGQFPYQAGLLANYVGLEGTGVCGGSLVSAQRVITAAHCWFDGVNQAWRFTVVLGSIHLFSGGSRSETSQVAVHDDWQPLLVRNDIAVIYLQYEVSFSDHISPIGLPSESDVDELYVNADAVASGFGLTSDGGSISGNQVLSHVELHVISNSVCSIAFPFIIQPSNICTSGLGGTSTCRGDSGGPLVVHKDGKPILVGVTSFGSALGCQINFPAAFARVSSFLDFINKHIN